jgi:hypothetical protein
MKNLMVAYISAEITAMYLLINLGINFICNLVES